MRFYWPVSNLTFSWSAENEYKQFIWIIFAYSIFQENWKIELAEPCTDLSGSFNIITVFPRSISRLMMLPSMSRAFIGFFL